MEKVGPERRMIVEERGQGLCSGAGAEKDRKNQPERTGIAGLELFSAALVELRPTRVFRFKALVPGPAFELIAGS